VTVVSPGAGVCRNQNMLSTSFIAPLEIAKNVFFVVYVAATIGVIVGVYWEGEQFPKEKQQRGWTLLVRSLAIDTLFTILVFGADGWISAIQRSEIITLESRLAARSLSNDQAAEIVSRLNRFHDISFQIIPYWQNKESLSIADRIADILMSAEWTLNNPKSFTALLGVITGVYVATDKGANQEAKDAAWALVEALNANGIEALLDAEHDNPNPTNTIDMKVGIKP
jgi:hypothetical protein